MSFFRPVWLFSYDLSIVAFQVLYLGGRFAFSQEVGEPAMKVACTVKIHFKTKERNGIMRE